MRSKYVSAGIFFGFGALLGWAVTADKAERDLRKREQELATLFDDFIEERDGGWTEILNEKTEQIFALQNANLIERNKNIKIPSFREGRLLNPEEVEAMEQGEDAPSEEYRHPDAASPDDVAEVHFVSEESQEHVEHATEDLVGEDPGDAEVDDNDFEEPIIDETLEETRSNLQSIIDQYVKDPEEKKAFLQHNARAVQAEAEPPFVISHNQYAYDDEGDDYTKITISWYPVDRVLLDDDEDPITDVAGTVGWQSLNRFGDDSGDPDTVFVRNRRMETDFEVVRENDKELPLHVKYGMDREHFNVSKAAGLIKMRPEDL